MTDQARTNLWHLFGVRRFAPLLATQFSGAFNDNLFKNALIMLLVFGTDWQTGIDTKILVTVAAGMFILPYVLFSATAGQLADKYEKSTLARRIKYIELSLMILATLGFMLEQPWILLAVLFGMGLQSTFFSPIKYSLVPDHVKPHEVLGGNALIEAFTFLAILTGTIAGGLLIKAEHGVMLVYLSLLALASIGLFASHFIPPSGPFVPEMKIRWNIFTETKSLLNEALKNPDIRLPVIGSSWFWFVGVSFFSQFPAFTKYVLAGDEAVTTLLLTAFSIGIAAGSMLANTLAKGKITPKYVPLAMLLLSVFTADLFMNSYQLERTEIVGVNPFMADSRNWRILMDLVLIALCGGVFIVPLNSMIQVFTPSNERARMIAANNALNALFMVASSLLITLLLKLEMTIPEIFLLVAVMNLAAVAVMRPILKQPLPENR